MHHSAASPGSIPPQAGSNSAVAMLQSRFRLVPTPPLRRRPPAARHRWQIAWSCTCVAAFTCLAAGLPRHVLRDDMTSHLISHTVLLRIERLRPTTIFDVVATLTCLAVLAPCLSPMPWWTSEWKRVQARGARRCDLRQGGLDPQPQQHPSMSPSCDVRKKCVPVAGTGSMMERGPLRRCSTYSGDRPPLCHIHP